MKFPKLTGITKRDSTRCSRNIKVLDDRRGSSWTGMTQSFMLEIGWSLNNKEN